MPNKGGGQIILLHGKPGVGMLVFPLFEIALDISD